jgi:capsular polysaccharide biosynthesis protein
LKKNKLSNSYLSIRTLPINYQKKDNFLFNHELEKYIDSSYFIKKRNLYIRDMDLFSFKYFSWNYKYTKMKKYPIIFSFKKTLKNFRTINFKKQKISLENGIWALDEKSFHYFHWFCDTLTRYLQVKTYNNQYPLLISSNLIEKEYIRETLNLLNINYSIYDYEVPYKIDNLLISSHITDSGNYSNSNITLLSSLLKSSIEVNTPKKRIWISRNKSKHRKIANEDSLTPMLKQYGFQIIYPEDISFIEQLSLYRNAEIIGGLHGGALTNILFMNEGTKLIEIRRYGDNMNNCYFSLASELKIDYYYLESESIDEDFYISDVKVEVQKLEKIIKNIDE